MYSSDWEKRKKRVGRPKKLQSPQILWEHACDYFKQCDDNPWIRIDYKGKDPTAVEIPTSTPYTWDGLENYLDANDIIVRLDDYKSNKDGRYREFADIIARIGGIIRDRKLSGAIVGTYNPNIVSRELGLADKKEVTEQYEFDASNLDEEDLYTMLKIHDKAKRKG